MSDPAAEVKQVVSSAVQGAAAGAVAGVVAGAEAAGKDVAATVAADVKQAAGDLVAKAQVHSLLDDLTSEIEKITQWPSHLIAEVRAKIEAARSKL